MKAFKYKDRIYLRVIPAKFMMNSTMIYEITTRGDILGMDIETQVMTVIKGTELVEHLDIKIKPKPKVSELDFTGVDLFELTA